MPCPFYKQHIIQPEGIFASKKYEDLCHSRENPSFNPSQGFSLNFSTSKGGNHQLAFQYCNHNYLKCPFYPKQLGNESHPFSGVNQQVNHLFCGNCGANVQATNFCPHCGFRLAQNMR
jgi:hypothetical protein